MSYHQYRKNERKKQQKTTTTTVCLKMITNQSRTDHQPEPVYFDLNDTGNTEMLNNFFIFSSFPGMMRVK